MKSKENLIKRKRDKVTIKEKVRNVWLRENKKTLLLRKKRNWEEVKRLGLKKKKKSYD